ncbi:nucleotidyltransferase family protein [Tahibacter caeni]|uniref:nucleotidyltransferase family protein n=1 Tax=Tahibacter caeni TaxID=1453545 RepID=UPI0021475C43|nr:nucleotidyltransferase family protein [Tahibacter caeni]
MNALHGAVILAAGASRRLGFPKQLVEIDGEPLLRRAALAALATGPADCVVVLGHAADRCAAAVADLPLRCVIAPDWQRGMGPSLRHGVAALDAACTGVLVVLCDQPALDAAHLQALRSAWIAAPQCAAASGYSGAVGVPALLPRDWLQAAALDSDRGARDVLQERRGDVRVVVNETLARDVDRPGDLPPP